MFRWLDAHFDTMALTIVVWLCSLPLVVLLVTPFFGLEAAAVAVFVLFFLVMAMCWGICSWKVVKG